MNARVDAYYRGELAKPKHNPESLEALNDEFQRSPGCLDEIEERARRDFLYNIKMALEIWGDLPVRSITRKAVMTWYQSLYRERGASNSRNAAAALRRLLAFGVDQDGSRSTLPSR